MTEEAYLRYKQWEDERMEKYGFIVHIVPDQISDKTFINMHTHGLERFYPHRNIRAILNTPYTHQLINLVGERIVKQDSESILADGGYMILKNGLCYGYLIKDPDSNPSVEETDMLRLISICRHYRRNHLKN